MLGGPKLALVYNFSASDPLAKSNLTSPLILGNRKFGQNLGNMFPLRGLMDFFFFFSSEKKNNKLIKPKKNLIIENIFCKKFLD
ncbi:MAG: hypothetical protein CM15mP88_1430 [Pseudomonadota bacterium]|nr:MAG: hypothetical protein CM15mP88_1430 [Pseudomonadota bacterium]